MPWIVKTAEPSQATGGLKITGENTETTDPLFAHFIWDVGHYSLLDTRYDFSECAWEPGALEVYARLLIRARRP